MKRKRKVSYEVHYPGMWWTGKKHGWVADLSTVDYEVASSARAMKTARKAFYHAKTLPPGAIVTRYFYKKGKIWSIDYVRT